MTLFDPGPALRKSKPPKTPTAADLASGKTNVYEITVKRLLHADIAALVGLDPKLARKLGRL